MWDLWSELLHSPDSGNKSDDVYLANVCDSNFIPLLSVHNKVRFIFLSKKKKLKRKQLNSLYLQEWIDQKPQLGI